MCIYVCMYVGMYVFMSLALSECVLLDDFFCNNVYHIAGAIMMLYRTFHSWNRPNIEQLHRGN